MARACASAMLLVILAATLAAQGSVVTTLAGSGTSGFADGPAMTARFSTPYGVAVMKNGSIVVGDYYNYRVRMVAPDGTVTTLAGSGTAGFADGPATTARFNNPSGVAVMQNGSVIVADNFNHRIRLVAPDGTVTTLAGSGTSGYVDGPAMTARFYNPQGVAVMQNGSIVVADSYNHQIRLVHPDGTVTTLASAQFTYPYGVAVMKNGNIVVADSSSHRIRMVAPDGTVTTLAGSGIDGYAEGPATTARFSFPYGVAVMKNGSVVVADRSNCRLRLVAPDGAVTTLAGSGIGGFADGPLMTARFNWPYSVAIMQNGMAVVTDSSNNRIRLVGGIDWCSTGYTGAACSSCAADYSGYPTCTPAACSIGVNCNGHASSVSGTLVSGCTCTCSTGYSGAACNSCATDYAGYPTCTLTACGRNVTLLSQPPSVSLLSLSQGDSVVTMVLSAKSINSVVVVYQKGVAQAVSFGFLSGVSKNDFNSYATCATMPEGISVAADGTGTVTYSHAVNYTLCEQILTDDYLVISCAFEVEHYVWLTTDLVPVMTATEAPVVVRVPRTVEQTIEAERFTFQIFPGLLVGTARHTTYAIRNFTLVESSSWIASSSMCTLSANGLSFSCILDPMTVAGEHRADIRVVFVNDEASSVGILASVRTYYIGKYAPNIFGRSVALHFVTTDLHYGPSEALVFLYGPNNTALFGFSTYLSALLLVNAAGESISVMDQSAFNLTCSNVPATNLTQCSFLPAAVHAVNRRFDAINPNLTLRATFSFESHSKRRDTEDVLVASDLTIDEETSASGRSGSSRTALIVAVPVACGAGLLLVAGAVAYVAMRRHAAVEPAVEHPNVCAVESRNGDGAALEPVAPCDEAARASPLPNPLSPC